MTSLQTLKSNLGEMIEDDEVQRHVGRAARSLRDAGARAGKAGSKRKAVEDDRLRARLLDGGRAAAAAVLAARTVAERRQRRQRRRNVAVAGVVAAGVVAGGAAARARSAAAGDGRDDG
jgi:hypothetical protein